MPVHRHLRRRAGQRDRQGPEPAVGLVGALLLVLLAPVLVLKLFGDEFEGSIVDLRILALGAFGIVALKQIGNALTARRLPTRASFGIGFAFVATIVLDQSAGGRPAMRPKNVRYSWTVISSYGKGMSMRIPSLRRTSVGLRRTSTPHTRASPASGRVSPERTRRQVVLPAPLGPKSPKTSPSRMSRETPSRARTRGYCFTRPFASTSILAGAQ